MTPFVHEFTPCLDFVHVLKSLAQCGNLIAFDSARVLPRLGRYSFIAADPVETFVIEKAEYGADPFQSVRSFPVQPTIERLPPFQGGIAGVLGYELGGCWERLPDAEWNEFQLPAAVYGIYPWVVAWDHQEQRNWFIGRDAGDRSARSDFEHVMSLLSRSQSHDESSPASHERLSAGELHASLIESHELPLRSNFSQTQYLEAVERVIEYIRAGDIFQANLSQRLLAPASRPPIKQYLTLRERNPAPFAGYFQHDDWVVMSSSPERFLKLQGDSVSTRPIKGTRQRRGVPEADLFTRDELRESEKDHAENVMIVDLLRNDLSRVCRPGTVRVPELCSVETYETVTHLVSEVTGMLRPGARFWDLVAATFPGGSITGAPKIRAMEIITELERVSRGFYCGSLFYHGFDGTADSNILIRTMTQRRGWLQFPVGGGVVVQSNPHDEYEETLIKAMGMIRSLS